MKIKKGDTVLIISGKDRGKTGKVLDVFPEQDRLVVEGANIRKRHMKPKKSGEKGQIVEKPAPFSASNEKGQIVEKPAPFSASNVKLICPKCGKPARIGYKVAGDKKHRICKKCQTEI